jgi:protein-disulfide isomerase
MFRKLLLVMMFLAAPWLAHAQGGPARYPLKAEDGSPILNSKIKPDRVAGAEKLPGAVIAANPKGDVTLVEFYDLNCPFCRRASADVDALVKSDPGLRLVLVPFPVLGIPSILAGRVELAAAKSLTPEQFYQFHRALYAGRGTIDGQRALAVATGEFGLDAQKIVYAANDDAITETMKAHLRFADSFGLKATPSYLIHDVAIQGHPGHKTLQSVIRSVRKCGKAVC